MNTEEMSIDEKMHDVIKESIIDYLIGDTSFFNGMDDLGTMTNQVYNRLQDCLIDIVRDEVSNYEKHVKNVK